MAERQNGTMPLKIKLASLFLFHDLCRENDFIGILTLLVMSVGDMMFAYSIFLREGWYCYNKLVPVAYYNASATKQTFVIKNLTLIERRTTPVEEPLAIWGGEESCSLDLGFRWLASPALLIVKFTPVIGVLTTIMTSLAVLVALFSRLWSDANEYWTLILFRLGINIITPVMGLITVLSTLIIAEVFNKTTPLRSGFPTTFSSQLAISGILVFLVGAVMENLIFLTPGFRPSFGLVRRNWLSTVYEMHC